MYLPKDDYVAYHLAYEKDVYKNVFEQQPYLKANYKPQKIFDAQQMLDQVKKHMPTTRKNVQLFDEQFNKMSLHFDNLIKKGFHVDDFISNFFLIIDRRLKQFFTHLDQNVLVKDHELNYIPDDYQFPQIRTHTRTKLIEISNEIDKNFSRKQTPVQYDKKVFAIMDQILTLYEYLRSDRSWNFMINISKFNLSLLLTKLCENETKGIQNLKQLIEDLFIISMKVVKDNTSYVTHQNPLILQSKQIAIERFHKILEDRTENDMEPDDILYVTKTVCGKDRNLIYDEFHTQLSEEIKKVAPEYFTYASGVKSQYQNEREELQKEMTQLFRRWNDLKQDETYYLVLERQIDEDTLYRIPLKYEEQLGQLVRLNQFQIKASQLQYDATSLLGKIIDHKDQTKIKVEGKLQEALTNAVKFYEQRVHGRQPFSGQIKLYINELFHELHTLLLQDPERHTTQDNHMDNQIQAQLNKNKDNPYLLKVHQEKLRNQQIRQNQQVQLEINNKAKAEQTAAQVDRMLLYNQNRELYNETLATRPFETTKPATGKVLEGNSYDYKSQMNIDDNKYQRNTNIPGKYQQQIQNTKQPPQHIPVNNRDQQRGHIVDDLLGKQPQQPQKPDKQDKLQKQREEEEKRKQKQEEERIKEEKRKQELKQKELEIKQKLEEDKKKEDQKKKDLEEKKKQDEEKRKQDEQRKKQEIEEKERLRKQQEIDKQQKLKEEEAKRQKEAEDRKKRDEEDKKRKEEERKQKDIENQKKKEEDDRRKEQEKIENERKRKEKEEEDRKRKELDDKKRKEEEEKRKEADRLKREEDERKREELRIKKEEEDRKRKEDDKKREEEKRKRDEEEREKKKREEDDRKRKEEQDRIERQKQDEKRKQEEEQRKRAEEQKRLEEKKRQEDEKRRQDEEKQRQDDIKRQQEEHRRQDQLKKDEEERKRKQKEQEDKLIKQQQEQKQNKNAPQQLPPPKQDPYAIDLDDDFDDEDFNPQVQGKNQQSELNKLKGQFEQQPEDNNDLEQIELVQKKNIDVFNKFIRTTRYGKQNPVNLEDFNALDFVNQIFEEHIIQDEAYFLDYEESAQLLEINEKMMNNQDPEQDVDLFMKTISLNFQQRTQKQTFAPQQRIFMPFESNDLNFYLIEKDPVQKLLNIYFEKDPTEDIEGEVFQNLLGIFQNLFDCDEEYQPGQIVVDPVTQNYFDNLKPELVYIKYMLTLQCILGESQAEQIEVKITKETQERVFWFLHSQTLLYEELQNGSEELDAFFEQVIAQQDKSIHVHQQTIEYSQDSLQQLQIEIDELRTKFTKEKQIKQIFMSIEVQVAELGNQKMTFFGHLSKINQLNFFKVFALKHYDQLLETMVQVLFSDDGLFHNKIYLDNARHYLCYDFPTIHLGAWIHLVTKKGLSVEDAALVLNLSTAGYYAIYKKLD